MPKVSVIIPVYNAEKYLRQCLDSVLGQTLQEIEVICVNDCSTDQSLMILQEYAEKDSRVVVLNNIKNVRAGSSRNRGLEIARGEYIHFLDADDYVTQDGYQIAYGIAHHSNADILRTKAHDLDANTLKVSDTAWNSLANVQQKNFGKVMTFLDSPKLFMSITVAPWGGIFRREFLLQNKLRFNSLMCVNDRSFYSEAIFCAKRILIADVFLVYYRVNNSDSLIGNRAKYFECHFQSYALIEKASKVLPEQVRRNYLENELYDICHWLKKLQNSEFRDSINNRTLKFLAELNTELWGGKAEETSWYRTIREIVGSKQNITIQPKKYCTSPKVSVIMSVYNARQYLLQAVESVLKQSLQEIELICVDDGSIDDSVDILRRCAEIDKRLCIIQQKNQFAGKARNNGIVHARGKYITFLDSDDLMIAGALDAFWERAEETEADVVLSRARYFSETPELSSRASWVLKEENLPEEDVFSAASWSKKIFQISSGEPWAKMFRREFIQNKYIEFPTLPRSEDAYFVFLAYSQANRITTLKRETVLYRKIAGQGLEEKKDIYPLAAWQSRFLLYEKLKKIGNYEAIEQSFINNVIDSIVYHMTDFQTSNAFEQMYSECMNHIVPTLKIDFSDSTYFYHKRNYQYIKELAEAESCLDYLYSYYRQYRMKTPTFRYIPEKYNNRYCQQELARIHSSASYRIGRFITFIPRKLRGGIRCYQEHGWSYTWQRVLVHLGIRKDG